MRSPLAGALRGAVVPTGPVGGKCPSPGGDHGPGAPESGAAGPGGAMAGLARPGWHTCRPGAYRVGGLAVGGGSPLWHQPGGHMGEHALGVPVDAPEDAGELPARLSRPLSVLSLAPPRVARRRGLVRPTRVMDARHPHIPWQERKAVREPTRPTTPLVSAPPFPLERSSAIAVAVWITGRGVIVRSGLHQRRRISALLKSSFD